jgi:hypothetical protein
MKFAVPSREDVAKKSDKSLFIINSFVLSCAPGAGGKRQARRALVKKELSNLENSKIKKISAVFHVDVTGM